jgi:hypothetical protein
MDDVNAEPAEELEFEPQAPEPPESPPMEAAEPIELGEPLEEGTAVALLPALDEREDTAGEDPGAQTAGDESQAETPPRPSVTFMGNNVDLASLGALASAILMIFICLTCNMGIYCLPVVPLALGLVGLLMASRSVDMSRTRFWSWIGVGTGTIMLILLLIGILLYVGLVWLLIHYSTQEAIFQALNPLAGI